MDEWRKSLSDTIGKNQLVEIDRSPVCSEYDEGFVLRVSDRFLLMSVLDPNMYLNGYSVVRLEDVKRYRVMDNGDSFASRALKLRGIMFEQPSGLSLDTLPDLLRTANEQFPLVTIHRESMDDSVCYIGKVAKFTPKTVTLDKIDPAAEWNESTRYNLKDITRVDFGGGYENALWEVSEDERKKREQVRRRQAVGHRSRRGIENE